MFTKILIPLDRSSLAEESIGRAASIARASKASVDVVLVHQPLPFGGFADMPWDDDPEAEEKYVETIAAEIASGANVSATSAVLQGAPAEMICRRAREVRADLIVMTSHGRTGFSRTWLGSVADSVMRNAAVPVLMLRPERPSDDRRATHANLERVLVPLDGSALAADVLPAATSLARSNGASMLLLRVAPVVPIVSPYDPAMPVTYVPLIRDDAATDEVAGEANRDLQATADRLHDESGVSVQPHVVTSEHTATAIVDFADAHDVDVIAMSTHGRGASRWLFGSVADKVLRASRKPVLLRRSVEPADDSPKAEQADLPRELPSIMPD
jgi:nucleotide-binding universal stress UspA family protein